MKYFQNQIRHWFQVPHFIPPYIFWLQHPTVFFGIFLPFSVINICCIFPTSSYQYLLHKPNSNKFLYQFSTAPLLPVLLRILVFCWKVLEWTTPDCCTSGCWYNKEFEFEFESRPLDGFGDQKPGKFPGFWSPNPSSVYKWLLNDSIMPKNIKRGYPMVIPHPRSWHCQLNLIPISRWFRCS